MDFLGKITTVISKFDFLAVKTVEIAKRCLFFIAAVYTLWYDYRGVKWFSHHSLEKLMFVKSEEKKIGGKQ